MVRDMFTEAAVLVALAMQAGLMLCDVCSKKCDLLPIEGELTRAQVNEALGLPKETT